MIAFDGRSVFRYSNIPANFARSVMMISPDVVHDYQVTHATWRPLVEI